MDERIIANIKSLGLDMINASGSGHPGIVLGAAPIIYTIFAKHIKANPSDFNWLNRDRFVMSAGHGSALLYATLFMAGYDLTLDDLKNFRQLDSITPGHPEYGITKGVEATTGPLGQGFANAVGMAMGEKYLNQTNEHFNYNIYTLCSDGDLMEGITNEAASLAGTLKLNNLIVLYDSNNVCLDGSTEMSFKEDTLKRFEALGWNTLTTDDTVDSIDKAIIKAKSSDLPTIIEVHTTIGKGSKDAGTSLVHGKNLEASDILNIKTSLGIDPEPFYVDLAAKQTLESLIKGRSSFDYLDWKTSYEIIKVDFNHVEVMNSGELRNINNDIMNKISLMHPYFISGSADLFSSCKTKLFNEQDFTDVFAGKNIYFGVREHAMAAIANGLALSGLKPVVSTFLSFADYLKPALRLSAIMNLPVTYVFTHDSIGIGSDGPTHQPIEQLAMLRSTPNIDLYRPCDGNELLGAWENIIENSKPSILVVSKDNISNLTNSKHSLVSSGAYIARSERDTLHGIIIATGTEVHLAIKVAEMLYLKEHLDLRVVSMVSVELFLRSSLDYQVKILPPLTRKIVIEAATSFGWHRFVYNDNYLITMDHFGSSGKPSDVLKKYGFDTESVYEKIKKLFI